MSIQFSLITNELNSFKCKVNISQDQSFTTYKILNNENFDQQSLFISDITNFTALAKKTSGSFILIDHLGLLEEIDLASDFNYIIIKEKIDFEHLFNIISSIFSTYWTIENEVLRMINKDRSIEDILTFVASNLDLHLSINDHQGQIIYSTSAELESRIKSHTFRKNNKSIGSVSLYDKKPHSKDQQLALFTYIIQLLKESFEDYFLNKLDANKKLAETIFENIINKRGSFKKDLDKLKYLGWSPKDPYILIYLENLSLITEEKINSILETAYSTSTIFMKFDKGYIILTNIKDIDPSIFKLEIKHMVEDNRDSKVFISPVFKDIEDLSLNYDLLKSLSLRIESGAFDIVEDKIKLLIMTEILKEEFINREIIKLYDYDKDHDEDLLETLFVYLATERSYVKTSEILNLHRNTIVYRINKIEGIIKINMEDIHERIHVILSALSLNKDLLKYR